MSYVETSATLATVRMPSIVQEMQRAHKARLQRIKDAAISKPAPTVKADDPMVAILESAIEAQQPTWEERQWEISIPRAHWFSIIDDYPASDPRGPMVEDIQRVACKYFEVKRNDLLSPRRCHRIAYPRQVAFYIAKTMTRKSLPDIGRRFGGRDHTTILHGYRKIERLMKTDWLVAYDVAHVEALL